ncbi:MAG TPA: ABC transporter permease [Vicinamibacterales bacterium]|nr:ABC transporter permease [Vicinamibacterales bacterium]
MKTAARIYAALLFLLPPSLRRTHGSEMQQCARTVAARRGVRAVPALLADLLVAAAREWLALAGGISMNGFGRDVVHGIRLLRKTPGFTLAATATLALGIGANTAMFSLADATLLRPMPIRDPSRVVALDWSTSYPDYLEYRERTDLFDGVAGIAGRDRVMFDVEGERELRSVAFLSGGAFEMLGVRMVAGRPFEIGEDTPGAPLVTVVSYAYWQRRFGGNDDAIGRTVSVNGQPVTIIGVAARDFRGTSLFSSPQFFMPLTATTRVGTGLMSSPRALTSRDVVWMTIVGRLKSGITIDQATAAVDAMYQHQHPPEPGLQADHVQLAPLATRVLGPNPAAVRRFVILLLGVVTLTLVIGCANLANLLLARGAQRSREIGIRMSLGAGRARIVRQLLIESVLLAAMGGIAGIAVAAVLLRLLAAYKLPGGIDIGMMGLRLNGATLAATTVSSVVAALLFGAAPAWRVSRVDAVGSLRDSGRSMTSRNRLRSALLASQVALCLVLLTGSGLFLRSLRNALDVPLGFQPSDVALASVNLSLAHFAPERERAFYAESLARVRALPQVSSAAWASMIPTVGGASMTLEIEGRPPRPGEDLTFAVSQVGPDYFRTVGTRILSGRAFAAADAGIGSPAAIVNEEAARRFFDGNAVGRQVRSSKASPWSTIVGVAENTKLRQLDERPRPMVYFDFDQRYTGELGLIMPAAHLFVRANGNADLLLPALGGQLHGIDTAAPVYDVRTFAEAVRGLVMPQKMGMMLFSCFSLLALGLATVGTYGVASYVSSLRTREIGIRMALGAGSDEIRRLMITNGLAPLAGGLLCGLVIALWSAPLAAAFLLGLSPRDPFIFIGATLLVGTVALVATWIPARRAARLEPVSALRAE